MGRRLVHRIVAGVVRRGDAVLLVREQGPDDAEPVWAAPGGVVEARETLAGALAREIREETGLVGARPGRLAHLVEVDVRRPEQLQGGRGEATTYLARAWVFEVEGSDGEVAGELTRGARADRAVDGDEDTARPASGSRATACLGTRLRTCCTVEGGEPP